VLQVPAEPPEPVAGRVQEPMVVEEQEAGATQLLPFHIWGEVQALQVG
jgi:hypothetical protein